MQVDRELIKSIIDEHPGISVTVEEVEDLLTTCETITCKVKSGQHFTAGEVSILRRLSEITIEDLAKLCAVLGCRPSDLVVRMPIGGFCNAR